MSTLLNDQNKPLEQYAGGESYSELICFGYNEETEEHENFTDLYVTANEINFSEKHLTDEQIDQVQEFADDIQSEIREWLEFCEDVAQTERSLMYS